MRFWRCGLAGDDATRGGGEKLLLLIIANLQNVAANQIHRNKTKLLIIEAIFD